VMSAEPSDQKAITDTAELAIEQMEDRVSEHPETGAFVPQSSTLAQENEAERSSFVRRTHGSALPH